MGSQSRRLRWTPRPAGAAIVATGSVVVFAATTAFATTTAFAASTAIAARPMTSAVTRESFPGPDNTGVPAGVRLTTYTGPRIIRKAHTVIDRVIFTPGMRITISAPGVVIRDSRFETHDTFDLSMDDHVANASVDVWDSEFIGNTATFSGEEMAVRGQGWRLHRVNIHGYRDGGGIDGNNLVENSWIHDFVVSDACEHADGFQSLGDASNIVIRHNTIDMALDSCMTAPVHLGDEYGGNSDVTVSDNWLAGGSYVFYASMAPGDHPSQAIRFIGNHLSSKYFPRYGAYGVVNFWVPTTPGAVWSRNIDATTGATVAPPPV